MEIYKQQKLLELKYSSHNCTNVLSKAFSPHFVMNLEATCVEKFDKAHTEVKRCVHNNDHTEILSDTLFWLLANGVSVGIQSLVGRILPRCKHDNMQVRFAAAHVYIFCLTQSPWIQFDIRGQGLYFKPLEIPERAKRVVERQGVPLPMIHQPLIIKHNHKNGYLTFDSHVITGGTLKQHDMFAPLPTINIANSVAYRLEPRLRHEHNPLFNAESKHDKKTGAMETPRAIGKRRKQWSEFHRVLPLVCDEIMTQGNKFFFNHFCDTRYRKYPTANHLSYQGDKYVRALVQFHNKELITGDW